MPDDSDVVLDHHHDDRGTTQARRGAALFDVVVLSWAMGAPSLLLADVAPALADAPFLLLWLVLVVVEAATGASPGKHVAGVAVEDARTGGRPTPVQAVQRRPWGWLLPLQLLGQPWIQVTTTVGLLVLLAMLVTIERSPDRRGFHDRLAGTRVVDVPVAHRARLVVVVTVALLILLTLVLASASTPIEAV